MTPVLGPVARTSRPARTVSLSVLLAGCLVGIAMGVRQRTSNAREAEARFSEAATHAVAEVRASFRIYEHELRAARGAVLGAGGSSITRAVFAEYARSRNLAEEFPGSVGHGFIRRVRAEDEQRFVQEARRDGWPDFSIRRLGPHDGDLFVIQYVEPADVNRAAIGLDCASEPSRREAATAAMRTGEPTLTGPISLVQLQGPERTGFLMYLPVFRPGARPTTADERTAETIGWTYTPLSMARVLARLVDLEDARLRLEVFDVTSGADAVVWAAGASGRGGPHASQLLELYGRRWRVDASADPGFVQALALPSPLAVGTRWAGIGAFLALLVLVVLERVERRQRTARERSIELEARVRERTEALAHVTERLELATSAARLGVWDWDLRTKRKVWDPMMRELYGVPPERDDGAYEVWRERVHPEDVARVEALLWDAVAGRREYVTSFRVVRPDGTERHLNAAAIVIRDPASGEPLRMVGVNWDVTEQRQAADALRQSEAMLAERSKQAESANQAKTMFLASMSHELRTPMNAITGVAYLLDRTELSSEQRELLRTIERSTKTLLAMVNDILDLSKIEAGQLTLDSEPFRPAEVLDEIRATMTAYATGRDLVLSFDAAEEIPETVLGDRVRLVQVLTNLVGNAIKYTEHGTIRVLASVCPPDGGPTRLRFEVRDTGPGIAAEALSRLFTPFTQLGSSANRAGGTGLGLSIVKQLVERMGGRVGVDSAPGAGACFWFEAPFPRAETAAGEQPSRTTPRAGGRRLVGLRLLVVDDSDINRTIARRILELEGAVVETAADGLQAVRRVVAAGAPLDAVLMDVQMPELDGVEASLRIRKTRDARSLPIVALTAGALASERERALGAGMNAFISKPFEPETLIATIRRHTRTDASSPVDAARG